MKKLLFAIAGAAAFAALAADPSAGANDISLVGFENYTVDQTVIGYGDDGQSGNSLWTASGDDASLVKTYGGDNATAPSITEPAPFNEATDPNTKYLALDTNGSELQRDITTTVAADGTYIDTLVQFTPSESAPTGSDLTGAKLAIWLGVVNNVTNLYVQGNYWDFDSAPVGTSQAFALTGKTIEPGTWYRLTVKAISNILNQDSGMSIPAFQILVDGTEMTLATAPLSAGFLDLLDQSAMYASADIQSDVTANKIVPSIQAEAGQYGETVTLSSVGFKGTGALDDFVVTTQAPEFGPAAIDFTLTWPAGLTAVSYSIDGGAAVAISGASPLSIPNLVGGEAITFIVQNADGAQKTLSATAANGEGIDATGTTFGWPEYLGDAVSGAYQIDDFADLDMLRKGVAAGLATVGETFNQTANIDMSTAGPFAGIGSYAANLNSGVSFNGTYDGQGYKISNIDFTQRNYGGVFNQVKGGTIKNLTVENITCSTFDSTVNDGEWGCSIIGNVGLGSTVQGLTAMGDFGTTAIPCSHNVAGIAIRVCGGASNVVNGVTMLETLVKDCTNNATLHGFYTKAGGITALTQDQNGVPNDYALFDGCVNNSNIAMVEATGSTLSKIGRDGLSGILGYVADGTKIKDCVNNGTLTSALTTAKIGGIVGWAQGRELEDLGGNKNPAGQKMIGDPAGSTITGFTYATVDNGMATTVDAALVKDTTYLLEGNVAASETPVFTLAAAGDYIEFDAALGYTFAGTIAGEGVTNETTGTVTKYWIPSAEPPAGDYEVVIDGSDVVITPTAEDFAAIAPYVDTNDVAAVNALLAQPITGTTIPNWQAMFLGVEPTTNGLEQVAIKSISIAADGTVTVEMADGVTLKTGRGVDIKLKLMGSTDLSSWTQIGSDITNTKVIPAITPAEGETKKFYKVVVDFAATPAQN